MIEPPSMTPQGRALSIGPFAVPLPVALAPMSGITDAPFRRMVARFGVGWTVSEMVPGDDLAAGGEEARLRAEGEGLSPHVVQIAGCDPYWMGEGARIAAAAGADVIDINMGCPAKRVTNGWSGSALMRDLDHACRLIEAAVGAAGVPVTLKTRLGWDHGSLNAPDLARRAAQLGVRMVTIHGRTRQQFYKGRADWRAVRTVREAISVPLVVNGDIDGCAGAHAAIGASGADAVMVGRAAMGRPWLCGRIAAELRGVAWAEPSRREKAEAAVGHYEWLLGGMGREKGLRHARKHVAAYLDAALAEGFGLDAARSGALLTSERPDEVVAGLVEAMTVPHAGRKVAA